MMICVDEGLKEYIKEYEERTYGKGNVEVVDIQKAGDLVEYKTVIRVCQDSPFFLFAYVKAKEAWEKAPVKWKISETAQHCLATAKLKLFAAAARIQEAAG